MKKWKVEQVTDPQLEGMLNKMEAEGWTIFSIDFSGYPRIVAWAEEAAPKLVPPSHKKKA